MAPDGYIRSLLERAARRNHLSCHARGLRRVISIAALCRQRRQSAQEPPLTVYHWTAQFDPNPP
jgi:hypothetical protein